MVAIIGLYLLFAISLIINKVALSHAQPIFLQGMRLTISGFLLLGYLYFFKKHLIRFDRKHLGLFLQVCVFLIYLNYVMGIIAFDDFSSARWAFLINMSPFITALMSYFYFSQRITKMQFIGLIIGFVGFIPLLIADAATGLYSVSFLSVPGMQAGVSLLAYTYGWVVVKKLVKHEGYSPLMINSFAMASTGLCIILTSFLLESWNPSPVFNNSEFILCVSAVAVIGSLSYTIYGYLLKKYTATLVAFGGILYPLFSAILGWYFFSEGITVHFFVSTVFVSVGLYIFYKEEFRIKYNKVDDNI